MSFNKRVSKHEIYHEIIEHEKFDNAYLIACASIGHKEVLLMQGAVQDLLKELFETFGVNRKSRVAQAVRNELDILVESFKVTGCVRVEEFLDSWNNYNGLCPNCRSGHCSDSNPPHS